MCRDSTGRSERAAKRIWANEWDGQHPGSGRWRPRWSDDVTSRRQWILEFGKAEVVIGRVVHFLASPDEARSTRLGSTTSRDFSLGASLLESTVVQLRRSIRIKADKRKLEPRSKPVWSLPVLCDSLPFKDNRSNRDRCIIIYLIFLASKKLTLLCMCLFIDYVSSWLIVLINPSSIILTCMRLI